ncbi:hypothetical protein Ocin01_06422 [Orchesella cincta]|uniref:Uncharacterized protein n=1 Tax=Orchesella cincta TaxID=48709 RepID=A0A1D2N4S5_ORCCI|nr:hypothetical protein Ocin01_06422 [Orchesella cincta]
MENKYIIVVALVLGCASTAFCRPNSRQVMEIPADRVRDARQAMEGATNQLNNNLVGALSAMANASAIAGQNVSRSAALMIRGLVTNSFQLGGVVAYMPRLIFLDGPTQFIETLRLIRSNQVRLPNDLDSSIDTLLTFAGQFRDSGIPQNFEPFINFFPNIFAGVGDFLTTLIDSVFVFIAPVPSIQVTTPLPPSLPTSQRP